MRFTKMHGAGNDFIIIDCASENIPYAALPELARRLCARRVSIGADGLMAVIPAKGDADFGMLFYNSDGSLGEMCGNGARCIARYGYEKGLAGETQRIETTAGLVTGRRLSENMYQVRLNDPSLIDLHRSVRACGKVCGCAYVELGSPGIPHAVLLLPEQEELSRSRLRSAGMELRFSPAFPKGANVNFVRIEGKNTARVLTFERGVDDFTLACGTGCGSAAAVLSLMGLCSPGDIALITEGGELHVSLSLEQNTVKDIFLSGPTCLVCEGEVC